MNAISIHRGGGEENLVGCILCHDVRTDRNEIVFRKGHVIRADDVPLLVACRWMELHLLELGPDDIAQREAGERLARSISGESVRVVPSGHRHLLKANQKGLLKIDVDSLARLNCLSNIAVCTLWNDQPVAEDQTVAEAQITPLAVARTTLEEAERIGPCVRVLPFVPREVVLWVRNERRIDGLSEKLRRFGCSIRETIELVGDAPAIRASFEKQAGATIFLIAGTNALDPLDPVFDALEQMGATMRRIGMPVHPGTLLWFATWRDVTIIGLPTCGLTSQTTAFDLVLPKLLAEGKLSAHDLASMGHGGILRGASRQVLESVDHVR